MTALVIYTISVTLVLVGLFIYTMILRAEHIYYKDLYNSEKKYTQKLNVTLNNSIANAEDLVLIAKEQACFADYYHYKLQCAVKGLLYAENFLKPRKKREMWRRTHHMKFSEWKEQNNR